MDENNEEWDENGFDPTKEAFFSDLMEMEEDIAQEGYGLVEHAMSLVKSQYYNDAIEVLRQAIGVYEQINRESEIEAIKQKISEIYVLKEEQFRDVEIALDAIQPVSATPKASEIVEAEPIQTEEEPEVIGPDLANIAEQLVQDAQKAMEIEEFDEALEKYDECLRIYEELQNDEKIK